MDYPLISVRESLVPTAVVNVKVFEAKTLQELEQSINEWVASTQNLVVCPGPLTREDNLSSVIITYVSVGDNHDPARAGQMAKSFNVSTENHRNVSAKESDGSSIS